MVGSLAAVMLVVAWVALMAIGQLPLPDFRSRQSNTVELASTASRSAPTVLARRTEPLIPRLVPTSRGTAGDPAPLGVTLQGGADGGVVLVSGLVAGMMLSTGNPVGANAWEVPVSDLDNTWILPPNDFVGVVELVAELHLADGTIAHRGPIRLEWVGASPAVAAQDPTPAPVVDAPAAVAAISTAASVAAAPVAPAVQSSHQVDPAQRPAAVPAAQQRQFDESEVASLIQRGKELMVNGDLAGARLVLRRAAQSNNAEAALTLAATYDPSVLRELKVHGVSGDVALARAWYQKAVELGSAEAPRRLETLAHESPR